jgi:hypothetical protein
MRFLYLWIHGNDNIDLGKSASFLPRSGFCRFNRGLSEQVSGPHKAPVQLFGDTTCSPR